MTDCQSLATSMFFEPDWLERLLEDCKREAIEYRNVKLLREDCRAVVWNVCKMFGCLTHGVPGQACRLLERYLYKHLRSYGNLRDPVIQVVIIQTITPRFLLMLTCCVQLAAKMSSAGTSNSASLISQALQAKGESYTTEEINLTEADIFKTLDFRVPLWTSVDVGELLATRLSLPTEVIKTVAQIVDFAEYHQREIEKKVLWAANLSHTTQDIRCVRTLHLSAGAVAAAVRLSPYKTDPTPTLAQLLQIPHPYVKCLRDIILKIFLSNPNEPITHKRKFSSS